jgi:hypothetical protein
LENPITVFLSSNSTILMVAYPARLADLALRARRPREMGFQKKQDPGDRFEELFFTLSSAQWRETGWKVSRPICNQLLNHRDYCSAHTGCDVFG